MAAHGLRSVILIGGGEPTLYPRFVDFVHHLKTLGLQVAVVSNGSRGDRLCECARWLDERDWIRLPLDAGSNELFRAMHNPVSKSLTLDEVCAWVPGIKQVNPRVRIGFSFIIAWPGAEREGAAIHENIDEIVPAAARASLRIRLHRLQACPRARARRGRGHGPHAGARRLRGRGATRAERGQPSEGTGHRLLPGLREHQPEGADTGELEGVHAPTPHLPHAGTATGPNAVRPIQLSRASRRGESEDRGQRRLR
ncbi:MAG TPA: hypothetical protein DEP35_21460 [Deltaproteobacteria bacterium]|nr:hypothetical protein [Deltaproteobacteria bacterium]